MAHSGRRGPDPRLTTSVWGGVELKEKMSFISRLCVGASRYRQRRHLSGCGAPAGPSPLLSASRSVRETAGPTVLLPLFHNICVPAKAAVNELLRVCRGTASEQNQRNEQPLAQTHEVGSWFIIVIPRRFFYLFIGHTLEQFFWGFYFKLKCCII